MDRRCRLLNEVHFSIQDSGELSLKKNIGKITTIIYNSENSVCPCPLGADFTKEKNWYSIVDYCLNSPGMTIHVSISDHDVICIGIQSQYKLY